MDGETTKWASWIAIPRQHSLSMCFISEVLKGVSCQTLGTIGMHVALFLGHLLRKQVLTPSGMGWKRGRRVKGTKVGWDLSSGSVWVIEGDLSCGQTWAYSLPGNWHLLRADYGHTSHYHPLPISINLPPYLVPRSTCQPKKRKPTPLSEYPPGPLPVPPNCGWTQTHCG